MKLLFTRQMVYRWPEGEFIRFLKYKEKEGVSNQTLRIYWRNLKKFGFFLRKHENISYTHESLSNYQYFRKSLVDLNLQLGSQRLREKDRYKSVSSLNQYISAWNTFVNWLLREEGVQCSERKFIKSFKSLDLLPKVADLTYFFQLNPYEINKSFMDWKIFCLTDLFAGTGIRLSEVVRLQIGNISHDNREIILDYRFKNPRTIFLHADSYRYLCQYIQLLHEKFDMERLNHKYPLFINCHGNALSMASITYLVTKWTQKHLSSPLTPLILRNSYISNLYFKSNHLLATKLIAGYRSFSSVHKFDRINWNWLLEAYQKHPRFCSNRNKN